MTRQTVRALLVGAVAVTLLAGTAPAYAQGAMGSLRGRIVDADGKPVPDAELVFDFVGDYNRQAKATSNKDGEWVKTGLMSMPNSSWNITATKGDMVGEARNVKVVLNQMTRVPDIVMLSAEARAAISRKSAAGLSAEEVAKRNKRQAELEALFNDANTAIEAGNLDDAITKLTTLATEMETGDAKCPACYAKLGEVYFKKNDLPAAEAALLKSIERDPNQPGPYNALATIYNQQRKFDDATKMSQKAAELMGATGLGADAPTVFNQGIIFWNQGKIPEAKAQFEKAIKLDPTMAEAHYWYGMSLVNEGKLPDAKKPFEEYLRLAPTGQYADTAKAILATIK